MANYGCTIPLEHDQAQRFFESAKHPDIDELTRRDQFLQRVKKELPYHTEGTDIIATIPDIDIDALLNMGKEKYASTPSRYMMVSVLEELRTVNQPSSYLIERTMNIAA